MSALSYNDLFQSLEERTTIKGLDVNVEKNDNETEMEDINSSEPIQTIISGFLYRRGGFFNNVWKRRFVELRSNYTISSSLIKGGMFSGIFKLELQTHCEDSSIRDFCFKLTQESGKCIYFAADNITVKEAWTEAIHTSLSRIRLTQRKQHSKHKSSIPRSLTKALNNYISRPIIYIKVIRARNLISTTKSKDTNLNVVTINPYVKVSMGCSTAKTTTRMKNLNPDWGMVFSFDWDRNMRYAKIEVFSMDSALVNQSNSSNTQLHDFLGVTYISLFSLKQDDTSLNWYPLGQSDKKKMNSDGEVGEVELEISCSGQPDDEYLPWQLFRETQRLPEFTLNLPAFIAESSEQISISDKQKSQLDPNSLNSPEWNGFPIYFPPIETEVLEDISLRVNLRSDVNSGKVSSPGILFLTNYRLIFLSTVRITKSVDPTSPSSFRRNTFDSNMNAAYVPDNSNVDLSIQIPIASIIHVILASEIDSQTNLNNQSIRIRTNDCRHITFIFKEDDLTDSYYDFPISRPSVFNNKRDNSDVSNFIDCKRSMSESKIINIPVDPISFTIKPRVKKKLSIYSNNQGHDYLAKMNNLSNLEKCWHKLVRDHTYVVEALDSEEGPPAHRIYSRLKFRSMNRPAEKYHAMNLHRSLLFSIDNAIGGSSELEMVTYLPERLSESCFMDNSFELESSPIVLPLGWSSKDPSIEIKVSEIENLRNKSTINSLTNTIKSSELLINTFTKLLSSIKISWSVYDPIKEFVRMGVPNKYWRLTQVNMHYELSSTYPSVLVVPSSIEDELLTRCAKFRSKGRIPVLSWKSNVNGCTISRCSQPLIGLTNKRSADDEALLSEISKSSRAEELDKLAENPNAFSKSTDHIKNAPFLVIDARPSINAMANQAAGKGVESDKCYDNICVLFMDIANIHAARKSIDMLQDAVTDEVLWLKNLEASGWLDHVHKILLAASKIAHYVANENVSVLIHCSDGWDRTSQLASLSMLFLDDYYRTLVGFIVLVEKEWISFGHKFADRSGCTPNGWKDDERSPIFQLFLDCVHQCIIQMPDVFEFNQDLLLFLMEYATSGWFGNFLFNSEQELKTHVHYNDFPTISIWAYVLGNKSIYINKSFLSQPSLITPVITRSRLIIWSEWFLRWNDKLWGASWLENVNQEFGDVTKKASSYMANINYSERKWADDKSAVACLKCDNRFTFFRRKHHCRCCGQIFCEPCTRNMRIIPSISKWRMSRCCLECTKLIDLTELSHSHSNSNSRSHAISYGSHEDSV